MPYKSLAQAKSILAKNNVTFDIVNDCWVCTSHKSNNSGYPVKHGGTLNRFVYKWIVGDIEENKQICHSCDNRKCINPNHLWMGTFKENQLDKIKKNRQARLSGDKNPNAKLNKDQVKSILLDNRFIKTIAADYNISFQMVSRIKRKEAWNAI